MSYGLSSLTCGENGEGSVRAATDGYDSVPPDGGEGSGSGIDAATAVIDGRGSVLAWSAGARRLLGYAAGNVTGRPAARLLASDLPTSARRCLTEQRDWNGRVSLRHMDGGRVDLELLAHPVRGIDGSLRWILVTFTECQPLAGTHRAQPDAPFMDWAFTQSPFALAIHDGDLLCLRVNDRMCQMFGLTEDELCGRRLTEVLPGPQYEALERYMRQVLDTGEPAHRETYRRVPGETRERAWSVSVSPLKDQVGRTQAVWIGALDITGQYGARQRLTLLNEAGTHIGTTLDVTKTAQELADIVVPRLADLVVIDLLDAVLNGDEPSPGPLTGTIALRRVAHQSIFGGVPEAVVKPGDVEIHPESFPSARCLAASKAVLTGADDPTFLWSTGHNPARAATIRKFGIHSVLSVPIRARGVASANS
jgi:PAS domain S-box-containing protein